MDLTLISTLAEAILANRELVNVLPAAKEFLSEAWGKLEAEESRDLNDEEKLDWLTHAYRDENLVLVLGAGVSREYKLPDWTTLLQKLLLVTIQDETQQNRDTAAVLAKCFTGALAPDPLISARYLAQYYRKANKSFEEAIREAIYEEVDLSQHPKTFLEIRRMCVAPGREPNIDSIITYNYDDLLERCLADLDLGMKYRSIYAIGMNPDAGELPIYHVHGFLPKDEPLGRNNRVTLSEDYYHKQYSATYSWSNMVQISKFKDNVCLFIGTSFTDPNLRRLLDIARLERGDRRVQHALFRKRYEGKAVAKTISDYLVAHPEILDAKLKEELNLDTIVQELVHLIEKFEEIDALSFGVTTIWLNDWKEIPLKLAEIRTRLERWNARKPKRAPATRRS